MRYAVLSDVHANLEALSAVLARARAMGCDRIVCLGDFVGFNASPNECVGLLRAASVTAVVGNHDLAATSGATSPEFSARAARAIGWTRPRLEADHRGWLARLSRVARVDGRFVGFHGTPASPYRRLRTREVAGEVLRELAVSDRDLALAFFGHTHHPLAYRERDGQVETVRAAVLDLGDGDRWLVNPGSVGQSRDADARASFAVYDAARGRIEFHRVPYDVRAAERRARAAGLSPAARPPLAHRLLSRFLSRPA